MKMKQLTLCVAGALMMAAAPAFAITDEEGNASLQFSFVPPGARSLGTGGAFIGLADDATAAYTNPAGLTQLVDTEISVEYRNARYSTSFIVNDLPTYDSANSSEDGIGFLSVVIPRENWAVSFYRHEYLNYSTEFLGAAESDFLRTFFSTIDIKGVNYGASGAYKFSDTLSVGLGIAYSQFDLDSFTARPNNGGFDQPGAFASGQRGDDNDVVFNAGFLWKATERLAIGGVYRDGGNFEYTAEAVIRNASGDFVGLPGFPKNDVEFNVPRALGLGLNYKVSDNFGVNFDLVRMLYSDLTDNVRSSLQADGPAASTAVANLSIKDGTEVRLGTEYVFTEAKYPVVVRGGLWRDPEHTIRSRGTPTPGTDAVANARIFSIGGAEMHYTVGLGVAFEKFQIDAAADFSDPYDVYSVSGVYRF